MKPLLVLGFGLACFVGTAFAGESTVEEPPSAAASCCGASQTAPAAAAVGCAGVAYRRAPFATMRENRRIRRANRVTVLRRSCAGLRVQRGCGG